MAQRVRPLEGRGGEGWADASAVLDPRGEGAGGGGKDGGIFADICHGRR